MPRKRIDMSRVTPILLLLIFVLATSVHALSLTPATGTTLPSATQFLPYSTTITASAPWNLPLTWSATGLPAGLTIAISGNNNQFCAITGTPTVSGTFTNITITVSDSRPAGAGGPRVVPATYTLTINPYCQFSGSNTGTIAFGSAGNIDPSTSPAPITNTVTSQVNFQCGAGLAYTVLVTNPVGILQMTGANTIPFTLGTASGTSTSDAALIPLLGPNASPLIPSSTIYNYESFLPGSSSIGPITVNINWGGAAPGSLNATVNVAAANVIDTCSTPVNGSIVFAIDPTSAGPLTPNTTTNGAPPTVKCTNGQSHAVSCTSANGYQLTIGNDGTTDPIAYTITGCPATITGSGFLTATPINFGLSLNASGAGGYQNAFAGAHSDTITVQITY